MHRHAVQIRNSLDALTLSGVHEGLGSERGDEVNEWELRGNSNRADDLPEQPGRQEGCLATILLLCDVGCRQ